MIVRLHTVGPFAENSYVIGCKASGRGVLVDPGGDVDLLLDSAARQKLEVVGIWLTHAHVDHVAGVPAAVRRTGAPVALHPDDRFLYERAPQQGMAFGFPVDRLPTIDHELSAGEILDLGELRIEVLHVPGHSPGHVAFWEPSSRAVLSGDCVFAGSIGRTDLPGGSYETLMGSIAEGIFALGDDVRIYPGHGPPTTVEREKQQNPFFTGLSGSPPLS